MKMFKKIFATVLCVIMVFGSAPLSGLVGLELPEFNFFTHKASAATYSGSCGENLTWVLDTSTATIEISGTGKMQNFSYDSSPWNYYIKDIKKVVVNDGVESIGDYAFYGCEYLTSVVLPEGLISIGGSAFSR